MAESKTIIDTYNGCPFGKMLIDEMELLSKYVTSITEGSAPQSPYESQPVRVAGSMERVSRFAGELAGCSTCSGNPTEILPESVCDIAKRAVSKRINEI